MIRRRLTLSVVLAAVVALGAGCGGEPAAAPAAKTPQQLGAEQLLKEYEATPGCGCTGATRAKERAATLFTYAGTGLVATSR